MQTHDRTADDDIEGRSENSGRTEESGSGTPRKPDLTENAIRVLERRYLKRDEKGKITEKPKDMMLRVAHTIANAERNYGITDDELLCIERRFYEMIASLDFVPNSPTLMNAGRELGQLSACFVLPVGDSIEEIFDAIKYTALIHKSGGGCASSEARVFTSFCGVERFETLFERLRVLGLKENDYDSNGIWMDVTDLGIRCFSFDPESRTFGLRKIQKVWKYDLSGEDCIDVRTSDGLSIKTSCWHPFLVLTESGVAERRADELAQGDRLIVPKNDFTESWPFTDECIANGVRLNGDIAWALGYLLGTIERDQEGSQEDLCGDGVSDLEEDLFERLLNGERIEPRIIGMMSSRQRCFVLGSIYDRLFGANSTDVLPDLITKSPRDVVLSFVAGFTEASALFDEGHIRFSSEELAKDMAALFALMGASPTSKIFEDCVRLEFDDRKRMEILSRTIRFMKKPPETDATADGSGQRRYDTVEVAECVRGDGHSRFYDFTVDGANNYLAGEFGLTVVHNTGFSFSRLRPASDCVQTTKGVSSGPISFMEVFNAATETIKQGGTRRGANMGILRVDHPDIIEFITAKKDQKRLTNFNISVALTDRFMSAVKGKEEYALLNPRTGETVEQLDANKVFDMIVNMAWRNGEPGIIFIDRINRDNPTPEMGMIESTNPCGEQPLLPFESCNLGSINLAHMLRESDGAWSIDWDKLREMITWSVRFLDDVIDMNRYPLPQIEEMTKVNRKIGLGVMGFADMLVRLEIPYDTDEALEVGRNLMKFIHTVARDASQKLAELRGSFPNFHKSTLKKRYPLMRNATVTTIAPTGTISIIASCSSGIEPLFAIAYIRNVMDRDELSEVNSLFEGIAKKRGFYSEELMKRIAETGSIADMEEIPEDVRRIFVTAHDLTPEWHVRMQAAFQEFTDNAVSKTVNFPADATPEDVRDVYLKAYDLGLKGVTVYRDGSRDEQVLSIGNVNRSDETENDSLGQSDKSSPDAHHPLRKPRPRPPVTKGMTQRAETGCGKLYVTINEDEHGLCELFIQMGKSGGCTASQSEAIARLISLSLRSGIDANMLIKQLKGIRCPSPAWQPGGATLSCSDAIAKVLERYIEMKGASPETGEAQAVIKQNDVDRGDVCPECPECGAMVDYVEGCVVCRSCGYSRCW